MTLEAGIWVALGFLGMLVLLIDLGKKRFFKSLLFNAASGGFALALLWVAGHWVTVSLAVTPFTIAASSLLGIPGILAMLLVSMI